MARTRDPNQAPVTSALVQAALAPIIEWVHAERGRKTQFVQAFANIVHPETAHRTQVEAWLSTDPEKRSCPTFGNGLAILATAHTLGIIKGPKPTYQPQTPPTE